MSSLPCRTFIKGTAVAAGATLLTSTAAHAAELRPAAFRRMKPGAVRPAGWLATQLTRQRTGLNGRYQEFSHFLRFNETGWVRPDRTGGEEVPYWLRAYGDLGYVTGDSRVLADTERWINAVLATQAADGYFGPSEHRGSLNGHADLWPHMPMPHALRSWAEHRDDSRVESASMIRSPWPMRRSSSPPWLRPFRIGQSTAGTSSAQCRQARCPLPRRFSR